MSALALTCRGEDFIHSPDECKNIVSTVTNPSVVYAFWCMLIWCLPSTALASSRIPPKSVYSNVYCPPCLVLTLTFALCFGFFNSDQATTSAFEISWFDSEKIMLSRPHML